MSIKLIALDLDDTLLGADKALSPLNKSTLLETQKEGITLVLASGRPEAGMIKIGQDLGLAENGGWIISFNGGRILNPRTGSFLDETSLSREEALAIYDLAWREDLNFLTYSQDRILTLQKDRYALIEADLTGLPLEERTDLRFHIPVTVPKVILTGSPDRLAEVLPVLQKEWGHRWFFTISKPFFLEVTPFGVEKGAALSQLCSHLEILSSEVLAMGDGLNDLGMIRWAGKGLAMANAHPELKKAASGVAGHHDEDGVAHAVREHCFPSLSPL